jgi:hypothetical protein
VKTCNRSGTLRIIALALLIKMGCSAAPVARRGGGGFACNHCVQLEMVSMAA